MHLPGLRGSGFRKLARPEYSETILRLPFCFGADREQSTRQPVAGRCLDGRGSDVQGLAIGAAKSARRNVSHWHLDHAINLPVGRNPDDTPSEKSAIPEIALRVDTGSVGQSSREVLQEWSPVLNRTRVGIIVVDPNYVI